MTKALHHPEELLPWYVNGSLPKAEKQSVEKHLSQCPACAREVDLLRAMHAAAKQAEELPFEFAWQRLRRDMHKRDDIRNRKQNRWLPSLATAAALVIAIQGVMLLHAWQRDSGYQPAGAQMDAMVIKVKFIPDTTEENIRDALHAVSAEIITGPSAMGMYQIRLLEDASDSTVEDRISQLKARSDVFDYVQRD